MTARDARNRWRRDRSQKVRRHATDRFDALAEKFARRVGRAVGKRLQGFPEETPYRFFIRVTARACLERAQLAPKKQKNNFFIRVTDRALLERAALAPK